MSFCLKRRHLRTCGCDELLVGDVHLAVNAFGPATSDVITHGLNVARRDEGKCTVDLLDVLSVLRELTMRGVVVRSFAGEEGVLYRLRRAA